MKRVALLGLALVLAIGCNQSTPVATPTSYGSDSTVDVEVSIHDTGTIEASDLKLVSLSVPGMT